MNLTIDVGNTHIRMAVFDATEMICEWEWKPGLISQVVDEMRVERCAVACVGRYPEELQTDMQQSGVEVITVNGMTPTPLKMLYETPETLGADRLAAAVGAWNEKAGKPLLVIDCGTCITTDYVSADGEYLGGNISPGETLRLKAMHDYTEKLPSCAPADKTLVIGKNTVQAMQAGTRLGLVYEIKGYMDDFLMDNKDGHIFVTGGGLPQFRIIEGKQITIDKALVFKGLNVILNETKS